MSDGLLKLYVLLIAGNIGLAISMVLSAILFQYAPSPLIIVATAFNWVMMIKMNPVWKELWAKWTSKRP